MKLSWIWSLPLIATLGLTACGTTEGNAVPKNTTPAPSGPAGDAQSLSAYHWKLQYAFTPAGTEDQSWFLTASQPNLQLDFVEQRIAVKNLCNALNAAYRVSGDRLEVQRTVSTLRACNDQGLMQLEQKVSRQLPRIQRWAVQLGDQGAGKVPPRLTISFIDGSRWQLDGSPTAETQYGSAGKIQFLEIAPDRVSCSHGVVRDFQCMKVREIRYNDSGLKTHTGEWGNFYSEIEGYKHQTGVRNIVRVKTYPRQNTPADASSIVYKLDMVVESEQILRK